MSPADHHVVDISYAHTYGDDSEEAVCKKQFAKQTQALNNFAELRRRVQQLSTAKAEGQLNQWVNGSVLKAVEADMTDDAQEVQMQNSAEKKQNSPYYTAIIQKFEGTVSFAETE